MSDGRSRLKNKLNNLMQKTPRIDSFFKPNIILNEVDTTQKTLASCSNSGTSTTDITYIQNVTSSESFSNNTVEKDYVPIVDLISKDPAEWVINDLTIDRLLLKEIKQNIDYDLLPTKLKFRNKTQYLKKVYFIGNF